MVVLPIANKDRVLFVEVTLKDAQKIHSSVCFESVPESEVIVNQQAYSQSSYAKDKDDSSVVNFIRNTSLISRNDFVVTTREEAESSRYDVYQVKQPPKFVNKALDNLYASIITDMRKQIPGAKKGRCISFDKLGFKDELSEDRVRTLQNVIASERNSSLWPGLLERAGVGDMPKTLEFLEHFDFTVIPATKINEEELRSVLSSLEPLQIQAYHNLNKVYQMAKDNQDIYSKLSRVYHSIYQQPYQLIHSSKQRSQLSDENGYQKQKALGEIINFQNGQEYRKTA